jgi:hypothetical protein
MYCDKHRPCLAAGLYLLVLAFFLSFTACHGELPEVPVKEEFTKKKLEKLGEVLRPGILVQYQLLPDVPPYDTTVYWYVQRIYEQATHNMHLDRQSPPDNRWSQERQWKVYIIKNDTLRDAFTLPGGDFFITTGFLKSFKKEYELYFLLAFEAVIMHEGYMLDLLIREYNALAIKHLIEGKQSANEISADEFARNFTSLFYEPSIVEELDDRTAEAVCNTSLFDPSGIAPFLLNEDFREARWLQTRPSYDGRINVLSASPDGMCGDLKSTGIYKRYVLDVLD